MVNERIFVAIAIALTGIFIIILISVFNIPNVNMPPFCLDLRLNTITQHFDVQNSPSE